MLVGSSCIWASWVRTMFGIILDSRSPALQQLETVSAEVQGPYTVIPGQAAAAFLPLLPFSDPWALYCPLSTA